MTMFRSRRIVVDSSDDEEFPDIEDLLAFKPKNPEHGKAIDKPTVQTKTSTAKDGTVRRRRLGAARVDNPLLRPVGGNRSFSSSSSAAAAAAPVLPEIDFDEDDVPRKKKSSTTPQRIALRTRKTKPVATSVELDGSDLSETGSVQEETILEDFSEGDNDDDDDDDDASDFAASQVNDSDDDDFTAEFLSWSPSKYKRERNSSERKALAGREKKPSPSPGAQLLAEAIEAQERDKKPVSMEDLKGGRVKKETSRRKGDTSEDLANPLSKLRMHDLPPPTTTRGPSEGMERPRTPPSPSPPLEAPKTKGLVSPSIKISRIPATPHRPHMDTFWDQEFIDEWNNEHSPEKQLFPPSAMPPSSSPAKKAGGPSSPKKSSDATAQRAAKKAFSEAKHEVAAKFLKELDERVTDNKLSELSASTGGIRIEWSNKLNTTAGRAHWKRETVRGQVPKQYRHHASIELAEKVIDDEHRLLNVIAHEFCHLANFMVTGITKNPHGKEFKAWGAKVSRVFGKARGIEVTTKHKYEIDFKYVWACTACMLEYKRHSKSIHLDRHRCGRCKSALKQIKPVPRGSGGAAAAAMGAGGGGGGATTQADGAAAKKESEYQRFMKEQMKIVKAENAGLPQKDIMRLVATRWAAKKQATGGAAAVLPGSGMPDQDGSGDSNVDDGVAKLTIIDLT